MLFVDHDDYVFPEALERMYEFATSNALDVVHGKEVVKGWSSPGWTTWRRQIPCGFDRSTFECITPHKLYRRQFLLDHGIEFPEGRVRLEDFVLNGLVWSTTDRIGVLADYPCYQWRLHSGNAHKQPFDETTYWQVFSESVQPILRNVPPGEKRNLLLARWYRSRILERVGPSSGLHSRTPDEAGTVVRTLVNQLEPFPVGVDSVLTPAERTRAALLRREDVAGLQDLAALDAGARLATSQCIVTAEHGALRICANGFVEDGQGEPITFSDNPPLVRTLPDSLAARVRSEEAAYSDVLTAGEVELVIRDRADSVDWVLPGQGRWEVRPGQPGRSTLWWHVDARLSPWTAAAGMPLPDDTHEVFVRAIGLGLARANRLTAHGMPPTTVVSGHRAAVATLRRSRYLAVTVTSDLDVAVTSNAPPPGDVHVAVRTRRQLRVRVHFPGLHLAADDTPGLMLGMGGNRRHAAVHQGDTGIDAEAVLPRPPAGVYGVRARFGSSAPVVVGWVLLDSWPWRLAKVVGRGDGDRLRRAWRWSKEASDAGQHGRAASRAWARFVEPG